MRSKPEAEKGKHLGDGRDGSQHNSALAYNPRSLLFHTLLQINRRETVFSRLKMLMLINNVKWPKLYPDLMVKILLPGRLTVVSHPSPFMYGSA